MLKQDKGSKIFTFGSFMTTLETSNIIMVKGWLAKIDSILKPTHHVKLILPKYTWLNIFG